jgi:ubiquinone/menaquinone biosynthesis C-methylase UbiE
MTPIATQRQRLIPRAAGCVLEVGIGSGHNLPYYDHERVDRIWGVDPSQSLLDLAARAAQRVPIDVQLLQTPVEAIALPSDSIDTAVLTYTLCSMVDTEVALTAIRRVLRPNGRLLFCEHGLSPEPRVRKWQKRVTPVWRRFSGGCHLDRNIPALLERNGFSIEDLATEYTAGWRPASYTYRGTASVR